MQPMRLRSWWSEQQAESRTLGVADLQKLAVREVSVTEPHSKQSSRYRGG